MARAGRGPRVAFHGHVPEHVPPLPRRNNSQRLIVLGKYERQGELVFFLVKNEPFVLAEVVELARRSSEKELAI